MLMTNVKEVLCDMDELQFSLVGVDLDFVILSWGQLCNA